MFNSIERKAAAAILILAIAGGFIGYSALGEADQPGKVWIQTSGGDVILDHAYHASIASCNECHHNLDDEGVDPQTAVMNCRSCHYYGSAVAGGTPDPHPRAIGAGCFVCHERMDKSLAACGSCHIKLGFAFVAASRVSVPFPETVTFESEDADPVTFRHKDHVKAKIGCSGCHHEFYGPDQMEGREREKRCRSCHHDLSETVGESDGGHSRFIGDQCVDCHEDEEGCDFCHKGG